MERVNPASVAPTVQDIRQKQRNLALFLEPFISSEESPGEMDSLRISFDAQHLSAAATGPIQGTLYVWAYDDFSEKSILSVMAAEIGGEVQIWSIDEVTYAVLGTCKEEPSFPFILDEQIISMNIDSDFPVEEYSDLQELSKALASESVDLGSERGKVYSHVRQYILQKAGATPTYSIADESLQKASSYNIPLNKRRAPGRVALLSLIAAISIGVIFLKRKQIQASLQQALQSWNVLPKRVV